jgi:Flp pilus assembly protein TadB
MDDRRRRRTKESYDLAVGFFGFFAVAFFIVSLVTQLTGGSAVWASATCLVAAAVVGVIWIFRRRALSRPDDD